MVNFLITFWLIMGISNTIIGFDRYVKIRKSMNFPNEKENTHPIVFISKIIHIIVFGAIVSILWPIWDSSEQGLRKRLKEEKEALGGGNSADEKTNDESEN